MTGFSRILLPVLLFAAVPVHAVGLPDTGQDLCDNGSHVLVACSTANTGDAATYPRQDGRFGRDAAAAAGTLTKVGGGAAGFDYTKIANDGTTLAAGATLGTAATDWACTKDNITGLIWEVKTSDHGLRDWSWKYSWYSSNGSTNGGNPGSTGGIAGCNATLPSGLCNTQAFVTAVNAAALCAYTDWRLPTYRELFSLVHFGTQNPSIDTNYFPNTRAGALWSASSYALAPQQAWFVDFSFGGAFASFVKADDTFVRLVRGAQF
jgi:Protein of unknown function (DUF1566)